MDEVGQMDPLSLIRDVVAQAIQTDWPLVHYRQSSFAFWAAVLLGLAIIVKIVLRRRRRDERSFYQHSGFAFSNSDRPGLLPRLIRLAAYCFLAIGSASLIFALADPYLVIGERTENIKSREIVYLRDVSASMGFRFHHSKLSRAEVTQNTLMNVLARRQKKHDRAAYIIFSTPVQIWSTFTTSYESILFTIGTAPLVLAPDSADKQWAPFFIYKNPVETDESETFLHLGLQSVLFLFEKRGLPEITTAMKENPSLRMRSVVIITDGAADKDPSAEFRELRRRRITPYLIYIDPHREAERQNYAPDSPKIKLPDRLLAMVRQAGGQSFLADDESSVEQISETLDRLQAVHTKVAMKSEEQDIYYIPLTLACIGLLLGTLLRVLFFTLWRIV